MGTRVVLASRALADLERRTDFLLQADAPATAAETLPILRSGLAVLRDASADRSQGRARSARTGDVARPYRLCGPV
jgi:plasmid stabilization system protein ParE